MIQKKEFGDGGPDGGLREKLSHSRDSEEGSNGEEGPDG